MRATAPSLEGAKVFLSGRTWESLGAVAVDITVAGGNKCRESVNGEDG